MPGKRSDVWELEVKLRCGCLYCAPRRWLAVLIWQIGLVALVVGLLFGRGF